MNLINRNYAALGGYLNLIRNYPGLGYLGHEFGAQLASGIAKRVSASTPKVKAGFAKEVEPHAFLADNAYTDHKDRKNFGNYIYKHHVSNDRVSVYGHNEDLIISFRGTKSRNIFDVKDYMEDFGIGIGGDFTQSPDYKSRSQHLKALIKKHNIQFPGGKIQLNGHSLGGTHIYHMMNDPDIVPHIDKSHAFNPWVGLDFDKHKKHPKSFHVHLTLGDIGYPDLNSGATYHHYSVFGHGTPSTDDIEQHESQNLDFGQST